MKITNSQFTKQKVDYKRKTSLRNTSILAFGNTSIQAVKSYKNRFNEAFQNFIDFFDWKPRKVIKAAKEEVKEINAETAKIAAENNEMEIIINNIKNRKEN